MSRNKTSKIQNSSAKDSGTTSVSKDFTFGDRLYLKFGRFGTRVIHRMTAVVLLALVLFIDYLIVLFTAVNVVPNIAVLVQQGTGVTMDLRLDAVIAGWLLPTVFIIAAVLIGEIFLLRGLWRFVTDVIATLGRSLFRIEDEEKTPAPALDKTLQKNTGSEKTPVIV